jgi:hypothetical protein
MWLSNRKTLVCISIGVVALLAGLVRCSKPPAKAAQRPILHASEAEVSAPRLKIYPYSLIPGGVGSNGEFQAYRKVDPVLAGHYAGMDSLAVNRLATDEWLYASYRAADGIYWTKKPLLVHGGEAVLTDGENMVRMRCGNRLSKEAQTPVRKFEPPEVATDEALPEEEVRALESPPEIALTAPDGPGLPGLQPQEWPGKSPAKMIANRKAKSPTVQTSSRFGRDPGPVISSAPGYGGKCCGGSVSQIFVPEPGTWLMISSGLAVALAVAWFRRCWLAIDNHTGRNPNSAQKPKEHSVGCSRS